MSANPAFGTPTMMVRSNRGLPVRTLRYNRQSVGEVLDERIESLAYGPLGHVTSRIDVRFFGGSGKPNFGYLSSLSGEVLREGSLAMS